MTSTALANPAPAHATEPAAPEPTQPPAEALVGPVPEAAAQRPSTGLAAACTAGTVALYRERGTGTLRRLPYLRPDSEAREVAEYYAACREAGARIATIAADTGTSKATVRRVLAALAITEEVEDGDLDDVYEDGVVAVVVGGADEDEA